MDDTQLERLEADWAALAGRPELDAVLERQRRQVWAGSEYVAREMLRRPEQFAGLVEQGLLGRARELDELDGELVRWLASCDDEAALGRALRRFRQREMVRIIWRDLAGLAPLDETLSELSELAEVCVRRGLQHLYRWARARFGTPRDAAGREQQLVVLGMGKLGARELNLSSDIDLIFCFPAHGHTDGPRVLENEAFFVRLGRQLIRLLGEADADGFVFRVDMRLRPFGDSGPLVVSFEAMEQYLQGQARDWERYAMVKARALTGTRAEREALESVIRAFVYRRYIDFGVIESIRRMKRMIERELRHKRLDDNIKLGWGGIREIEFIAQSFQLVRGGRDRDLQIRSLCQVLERLGDKGLLPAFAVRELLAAYAFLRRVENRLQAWRDQQTHVLPDDSAGRRRLAGSMGFSEPAAFDSTLEGHRRRVQSHFERVFEAPQAEPAGAEGAEDWEVDAAHLARAGFTDAGGLARRLRAFRGGAVVRLLPAAARLRLDRLMPMVLRACVASSHPDEALLRVLDLLEAVARRTAYLDLLLENPLALSQLVRLLAESRWIGTQLARMPLLLDELLDPRRLYDPPDRAALEAELAALLASLDADDLEQEMERLRQFALGNRLRVAAADLSGALPLTAVSDRLTDIAEVSLRQVFQSAWRALCARYGRPRLAAPLRQGFAVIAFGKLGGRELGYGSDLDMVFLHGNERPAAETDGERPLGNDVFYVRLGQRLIHLLSTRTPSGRLYEVDMRLRPNGGSGLLVSSLAAFERYQREAAWTWEHQALVRARAVAGDPELMRRFEQVRREILGRERDPERLRADVLEMRARMAGQLDRSDHEWFDVKQGRGGLVDIEFLVQYAVLRWAHVHPGLTDWTDNLRLLERLGSHGLIDRGQASRLRDALLAFRGVIHHSALREVPARVEQGALREARAAVREIWTQVLEEGVAAGPGP